jgi:hypothetical protein
MAMAEVPREKFIPAKQLISEDFGGLVFVPLIGKYGSWVTSNYPQTKGRRSCSCAT